MGHYSMTFYMCIVCDAHNMKAQYAMGHSEREDHRVIIQTPEALLERKKPTKVEVVASFEHRHAAFIIDANTPTTRCSEPCEHPICKQMYLREWLAKEDDNV